jgi:hypothetical protein
LIIGKAILHRFFGRKTLSAGFVEVVAALGTGVSVILPSLMIECRICTAQTIWDVPTATLAGFLELLADATEQGVPEGFWDYFSSRGSSIASPRAKLTRRPSTKRWLRLPPWSRLTGLTERRGDGRSPQQMRYRGW